jgi:hypothetical protein
MATTKIWPIKGNLRKPINYVKNEEKTAESSLNTVLDYMSQEQKTHGTGRVFVTGIHCDPYTAVEEMSAVRPKYQKKNGIVAYHGYQSFAPGEVTPELAHEIGIKLVRELWGDRFQIIVATHLDKAHHIHNHFLINAVSFQDHLRFVDNLHTYTVLRETSDRLCSEYGLSVIQNPQWGKAKQYQEWQDQREGKPTWRSLIRADIDEAIRTAYTLKGFYAQLQKQGYTIKVGKEISVKPPGKERFFRLKRNFGEQYSVEGICRQIMGLEKPPETGIISTPKTRQPPTKFENPFRLRKSGGFQGLYLHYCYVLGIFQPKSPQKGRKLSFELKEELLHLEQITLEAQLLANTGIDTMEELTAYQSQLQAKLEDLTARRKYQRTQLRGIRDPLTQERAKQEITQLTQEITELRKKIKACDSIAQRSVTLAEKMREEEQRELGKDSREEGKMGGR